MPTQTEDCAGAPNKWVRSGGHAECVPQQQRHTEELQMVTNNDAHWRIIVNLQDRGNATLNPIRSSIRRSRPRSTFRSTMSFARRFASPISAPGRRMIAAVRAGELDEHLNQAAKTRTIGKVKKGLATF